MLDINLFRDEEGNNPEIIRESQRRRFANVEIVDEIIQLDREWQKRQIELKQLPANFNDINIEVAAKLKIDVETASSMTREAEENITAKKAAEVEAARATLYSKLELVGNLVHDSVPVGNDEGSKVVVRTMGQKRTDPNLKDDDELLELLGIVDHITDYGLFLERALVNFCVDFLVKRGSTSMKNVSTTRKDIMRKRANKVTGEGDDKHLIATAELPLCAHHVHDCIHPTKLPLRYVGHTSCLRPRACGRGKVIDPTFEKVEQLGITGPHGNASWDMLEDMIKNAEDFYQMLKLPYQVVSVVSGSLNAAASKTYDLEAWFPASNTYKTMLSCSNFTDYQSRKLDITFGQKDNQEATTQYCHLLNSTLMPTQMIIRCILENYQRENGVEIPQVLRRRMGGKDFLPFRSPPVKGN